jgi:hypothetical protein
MSTQYREALSLLLRSIAYPLLMTMSSFVPVLNYYVLFGDGGVGWFLISLSLVWVFGQMMLEWTGRKTAKSRRFFLRATICLVVYAALTYPLSYLLFEGLRSAGYSMPLSELWKFYWVPFSLLL